MLPPFPGSRRLGPLVLEVADVVRSDISTLAEVERRLNRTYFSCGCESGAVAVGLALATWAAAAVTHGRAVVAFLTSTIGWLLLSLAAAAFVGKVVGLLVSWMLFRRARRAALALMSQAQSAVEGPEPEQLTSIGYLQTAAHRGGFHAR
jgi:hypothetical protein